MALAFGTPIDMCSALSCCRYFYTDAIASGVSTTALEHSVIVTLMVIGFLISILLRVFIIAIILIPFFGLMHHARKEDGVIKVMGILVFWVVTAMR